VAQIRGVEEVSDMVFTASRRESSAERVSLSDDPYIILNASGLIPFAPLAADYGALFEWAHAHDLRVVVLPHVRRAGADDGPVCEAMFREFGSSQDLLVDRTLSPDEVRALACDAQFVVTGRMHLAVMALSCGVPAATLATVGKVEGLYELFELPRLAVSPKPGFSAAVIGALCESHDLRTKVGDHVRRVVSLARRNFTLEDANETLVRS
jgi:polysaccharide pyruvyl transferase WcaK-like protein